MNAKQIEALLDSGMARYTLENDNDWKARVEGLDVWIGAPSGSRTGKFDYEVREGSKFAVLGSARSFSSLPKALADAVKFVKSR